MIAFLKAGHIASLSLWCAGLLALPIILQVYGRRGKTHTQAGFGEFRQVLHVGYTRVVTPAAVIAIIFGTVLIVQLQLRADWLMAKLAVVAMMVLLHAWLGHMILKTTEGRGSYQMPSPLFAVPCGILLIFLALVLVLAKPDLTAVLERLPQFLHQSQERDLPSDLVPI
ncbi:MAG: hypothetical protein CVT79_00785 [Alphaproteobacteria bacterium HGW-Alphaproteobacteria-18]|nr:MAG: hypothetical protein CVT79_00785 [Alphaproteobacteria bacterium HGW-Alphaproteobacteria-18]